VLIGLRNLIGKSGHVDELYGGYEITVHDAELFPWKSVFDLLLKESHDIWVTRSGDKMIILTKPPRE
jgi:hypothetical protein